MCGICGIVNFRPQPVEKSVLQSMMKRMKHRGPDDEGTYLEENIGLGFVRLSIIDLSDAGHQPMYSHDQNFVIVYNGEIYNYLELKEELKSLGHRFKTRTDTEVLLSAFQEWGENCLDKFNGMFAFAILDKKNKSVFAARDRFGIKPLYYYMDEQKLIFASEIAAILKALPNKSQPDDRSVFDYLVFNRTDQTERTFFKNIKKVQHGHKFTYENGRLKITRWYHLSQKLSQPFSNPEEFKQALISSIGLRLRSDVPVGVCLSGGLDSSSIMSLLLKEYQRSDINTFSAVYKEKFKGDESEYINEYSPYLKNMHFTYPTALSLYNDAKDYVRAHNEPTPSTSPYAQFKVMEKAREYVVVTLDGQGADEELAGYHYFFGYFFKDLLQTLRWIRLIREIIFYLKIHRSSYGIKTFAFFLLPAGLKTRLRAKENDVLNYEFYRQYYTGSVISENLYDSSSLNQALLDHFEYKLEHLLKWEDRNGMWFSIEARVPFLDHNLVEKILSIPSHQIIQNGMTKHILRAGLKGLLPENIRTRSDKVGFLTPEDEWFRTEKFRSLIQDMMTSSSYKNRGYYRPEKVWNLYQEHLQKKRNISKEIWKWLNLELWFKEFIDKS